MSDLKTVTYDFLVGRTIVIHDCSDPKKLQLMGEYEILSVNSNGVMKLKDYPTDVSFSKYENFLKFAQEKVAFIHPHEVYAYLNPYYI